MTDTNTHPHEPASSIPPKSKADEEKKKSVSISILLVMMILGGVLVGFAVYQFLIASQTDVEVLVVDVEVKDTGAELHIVRVEATRSTMDLLESPRSDDIPLWPGVRAKLIKDQAVYSYDAFVEYDGSGVYTMVLGLKHIPNEEEVMKCSAWVYTGNQGSFPDDQESVTFIWTRERAVSALKVLVDITGSLEFGSNADIVNVEVTQVSGTMDIGNAPRYYAGVAGFVKKEDEYLSYVASVPYSGGDNYTIYLGLLTEPEPGDRLIVTTQIWQRDGEWLDGEYQGPRDALAKSYVWE